MARRSTPTPPASTTRRKAPVRARKTGTPAARPTPLRRLAPLGDAGVAIQQGIAQRLQALQTIEAEIAQLTRRTVVDALDAAGATARGLAALMRDVVSGAVRATEGAGSELTVSVKGAAKGAMSGVHEARGDVARAASEIMKTSMKEAHRLDAEAAAIARSALHGIQEALAEAGENAAVVIDLTARSALAATGDIGVLAVEAVRQVVSGSVAGLAEVAKSRRAAPKARRTAAA